MALVGVRLTTALAYVAASCFLRRVAGPWGDATGGWGDHGGGLFCWESGGDTDDVRVGFGVGLGAVLVLVSGRLRVASVLSVLAPLASPVAGLFLAVAGGALFLSGRRRAGVVLAVSALVPTVAVGLAFGNGGYQTFAAKQAVVGFLVCWVCGIVLAPPGCAVGWVVVGGAGCCGLSDADACGYDGDTSAGVVCRTGCCGGRAVPLVAVIAAAVSVVLVLPPVSITEVQERGDPALSAEFYAPLVNQLVARGVSGPIEVVPTLRRGEAPFVAPVVAIARGWSRPADTGYQPHLL